MKLRRNKKGFTIIELVIVIAVIGILAAVLIPTFVNLTNKANEAADNALVNNLNKALKMEEQEAGHQKAPTLEGAIKDLEDQGYILENLASKSGKDLLWSQSENQFLLNTEGKSGKDYWKIVDAMPAEENQKYSYYAGKNFKDTNVTAKYGFDAGRNDGIAKVTYKGTGTAQEVVIRTNSTETALTVNGPSDDVKHYGIVGDLIVTAVRPTHCYHEWGFVKNLVSFGTGKFVVESTALFHQTKEEVAAKFEGNTDSYVEGKDVQYAQHIYNEEGVCIAEGCGATMGTHVHSLTYTNDRETHTENCETCGYTKSGLAHVFTNGVCVCGKEEVTIKNGLVNGYYYLNNELYTGTITDNNKTIEFENGCLVVWAEDSLQSNGPYVVNHTFNKSSVDSKYLTDKIVLSSISSVFGNPGNQTFVSNKININFEGYSVESAKACDPSIMYSLSSTPWNNATVYADYMKLISETCGNDEYGDASTFPFYISSKDYTEYQSLSVSGLTFTDYLKFKYVSNVIVTSSTTAIETYMIKNGSEDKLSAYAYDNGNAGMGIILSKDGNAYFYSWSDLSPCIPSYTNISSDGKYSGYGYSVDRNGATIVVSYKGTAIDTLTITKNVINDFNLVEQKAAISTKSIADSCSKEELLALATDLGNKTSMRIDQAPEVMELFIKAFWSTYSFSNDSESAACSFDNFNATTLNNYSYKYVVQFVNGIGNAYQEMDHVGPIIKVIISKN